MSARSILISRLEYLSDAVDQNALIDSGVPTSKHNEIAKLLRKGLGIVAFNILEDFIKSRTEESLNFLSTSGITFNNLTEELKESSTFSALKSIKFNVERKKKESTFDMYSFLQQESYKIYSTSLAAFSLSKYSLLYSNSNIQSTEIPDVLKSLGINGGWMRLKNISDSIGGGIPDLATAFNNASQRRHSAAHDANFNYTHTWLTNIKSEIIAIAASFDIAISAKCRQITTDISKKIDAIDISGELNYRFLEAGAGSIIKEKKHIGGKTIKNWPNADIAKTHITPRLLIKKEFLIILNNTRRIIDWVS